MGSKNSTTGAENDSGPTIEVYTLLKTLGQETYTTVPRLSHHICLLRTEGKWYHTELSQGVANGACNGTSGSLLASSGKGRINIHFGEHYIPQGKTSKTLAEIEKFAMESPFNDTDYNLLLQNCQQLQQLLGNSESK